MLAEELLQSQLPREECQLVAGLKLFNYFDKVLVLGGKCTTCGCLHLPEAGTELVAASCAQKLGL